MDDIEAW